MVVELIIYTVLAEAILIHGMRTFFKYTDTLNELRGDNNND